MPARRAGPAPRLAHPLAIALVAGLCAPAPGAADAGGALAESARARLIELKRLEQAMLIAPAAEEAERLEHLRAAIRRHAGRSGRWRLEAPRDVAEAGGPQGAGAGARAGERVAGARAATAPANHLLNDRRGDFAVGSAQAELTIAASGRRMLAAWNDGEAMSAGGDVVGYAWSSDGGDTWIDGGAPPRGGVIGSWISDPVVTVNERTGEFYLTAMAVSARARNAIGVIVGRFGPAGFAFDPPALAREAGRDTLPDKPWIAADSLTGHLYLSYASFFRRGIRTQDQIEFQRWSGPGASWSAPLKLSAPEEDGLVQGARPAVGPAGEVVVAWASIDTTLAGGGVDHMRVRISRDGGASFGAPSAPAGHYTNFGSGAPGFNRPYGFAFPGLAVDRSGGPFRGRVYLCWNESIDFYRDALELRGARVESDPTATPADATPFTIGEILRGAIATPGDIDHFRFHAEQGQTVVLYLDSLASGLDLSMRLLCGDGQTRLAYCAPLETRPRLLVFTLPASGDYFLRIAPNGSATGGYRILTALHAPGAERARDHRDVFVTASDDGAHWSPPARVNDEPGVYDDWLPELAVDAEGRVAVAWYDWRDAGAALCGGASLVYAARSIDGGATWAPGEPLADQLSDWTRVSSNIAPNQGDYIALAADGTTLSAAWADGRNGTPDAYMARQELAGEPAPRAPAARPVIEGARPNPTRGELTVLFSVPGSEPVTLELVDLAGRRWRRQDLDHPVRGTNRVDLSAGARLPIGLYFLRVAQAGRAAGARVIVVR